jgi:hypothetical protein
MTPGDVYVYGITVGLPPMADLGQGGEGETGSTDGQSKRPENVADPGRGSVIRMR